MGNNGFSHLSSLGRPTSSAPNAGEAQSGQTVEQEQQATFSGRPTTSHDPENPYLTSLVTSQAASLSASTIATATSSTVQYPPATEKLANPLLTVTSASQPRTQSSATSDSVMLDSPEDPFAALATYQPTSFEEEQALLHSGFGILDDSSGAFSEELEAVPISSQPAGQTTRAPVMDSPVVYSQGVDRPSRGQLQASTETAIEKKTVEHTIHVSDSFLAEILEELLGDPQETQEVCRQDNNPPVNPPASHQGDASVPAPGGGVISGIPQSSGQSLIIGPFYPSSKPLILGPFYPSSKPLILGPFYYPSQQLVQQNPPKRAKGAIPTTKPAQPDSSPVVPPPTGLKTKVNIRKKLKKRPGDEYLLRTDSLDRPYQCGYPGCGKMFLSTGHLRSHIFQHTHVSDYRCTYPGCGPNAYFSNSGELKRHISRVHLQKKRELICKVCHRRLGSSKTMKTHVLKEHPDSPKRQQWTCEICDRSLGSLKALKAHVQKKHSRHSR